MAILSAAAVVRALHPTCATECAMDNGRVWAFCPARLLIDSPKPAMTEAELHAVIADLPSRAPKKRRMKG